MVTRSILFARVIEGRRMIGAIFVAALVASGAGVGCGGGSEGRGADAPPLPSKPADFPKPAGRSLAGLRRQVAEEGPILARSVSELKTGKNRFGFGLFDRARAQIADAPVAVYVAPAGGGEARGPYPAKYESLAVKPPFQSRTVASDKDAAKSLYVADVRFPKAGRYDVLGVVRLDNRLVAATPAGPPPTVFGEGRVPDVGNRVPRVHTETKADVRGHLAKIDTRQPPSTMHDVDFADALGRKPTVLLFATPALCQSRVCGPVVDIAEQVKARHDSDAVFIHQEIFRDNDPEKGYRPQVSAWRLQTEPWVFAIDRRGRVAARIEGAFSAAELERAVRAATSRGRAARAR
jgi:hypothetical protein